MFYSKIMFYKKGPLSKVWIAAHFQRKLNKMHVIGTDISLSAKSILDPSTPLALRLSGQLLLGLVRIYQRKVKYLQEDSTEALTKMKMMFRAGAVDLPEESSKAAASAITHVDNVDLIDFAIPDDGIDLENLDILADEPEALIDPMADEASLEGPSLMALTQDDTTLNLDQEDLFEEDPLDIQLGDDNLDDILIDSMDQPDRPISDVEMARGEVSDVEIARDGGEEMESQGFDIDIHPEFDKDGQLLEANKAMDESSVMLDPDMSGLDTTTGAEDNGGMSDFGGFDDSRSVTTADARESDAHLLEVAVATPKPKAAKKRKALKFDKTTELPGSVIAQQLKDTSDIVLKNGRAPMPVSKRAKLEHQLVNDLPALMDMSTSLNDSMPFEMEKLEFMGGYEPKAQAMCQALLDNFKFAAELEEEDEEEEEEKEEEEEDEEEEKEEAEQKEEANIDDSNIGDITTDFEFGDMDGGMDMFSADDMSTVISKSTAKTPAKDDKEEEQVEEVDEARREIDEDVDDFFGDAAGGDEGEEGEEEELGWSTRTKKMEAVLEREFKARKTKELKFTEVVESKSKRTAAGVFYQLLVLKSHRKIDVVQDQPYDDIRIAKVRSSKI